MRKMIKFNDAIKLVSNFLEKNNDIGIANDVIVLRDIHGRLRILVDQDSIPDEYQAELEVLASDLQNYAAKPFYQTRNMLLNPASIFNSMDVQEFTLSTTSKPFKIIDRTITGSGWSDCNFNLSERLIDTPKLAFFGLKGGVGRSTALTILAYDLARAGKNVMLIDLDIESPGLSSLILPEESKLELGVVDWVLESSYSCEKDWLLDDIVCDSPLSLNLAGSIKVVPAVGKNREFYLDKLSRVYSESKEGNFNSKLISLVEAVTELHKPDMILIDSRSGLHDIAALSIVGLADNTLLFGIDSEQSWQGYEMLFSFWNNRTNVVRHVRDKMKLVQSLMPEHDQINRANVFRQKAYTLFSDYLYDQLDPVNIETPIEDENENFSFDENDDAAPHYPIKIMWNNLFHEFQPLMLNSGVISYEYVAMSFGDLFGWVNRTYNLMESE